MPGPDPYVNLGGDLKAMVLREQGVMPLHRRGHHVQSAHGRWSPFASDGSHLSGCMIALMPTAADAKKLAVGGGEKAEDLHVTLFYLGPDAGVWDESARAELIENMRAGSASLGGPVIGKVFGIAHWNAGGDNPSWVWSVGDAPPEEGKEPTVGLKTVQHMAVHALEDMHAQPELATQHTPWVAHICAAYTGDLSLAKELEKRLGPVTFDRIRVSFADEDHDIPLELPEVLTAAAVLRREPLAHEADVDFVTHQSNWQAGVDEVIDSLSGQLDRWYAEIARQVEPIMDDGDIGGLRTITVDTSDLADSLFDQMMKTAQQAGEAVEREAQKQGVKVRKWGLTGRREKLMRRTADAMAGIMGDGLVLSARRHALSYAGSDATGADVAREVRNHLEGLTDSRPREAVGAALTSAQNAGRRAVLEATPPARYFSSEMLDKNTCAPCRKLDGSEFPSLDAAYKAYPTGGYRRCLGGGRCRGMVVARWSDAVEPDMTATLRADNPTAALYAAESSGEMTTDVDLGAKPSEGTKKDKRLKENKDSKYDEITEALAEEPAPMELSETTAPWRGPLTVEGIETGDGREFDEGALTWAELPLPLRWNIEDSHGGEARTKAVNVGNITKVWREGSLVMGEGLLDLGDDNGQRVHDKIKGGFIRGVSVDVDSIKDADVELVWPEMPGGEEAEEDDLFAMLFASPEKTVFHKGRIRAATVVDIPAFAEAYIALLDDEGAVVAGGTPIGALRSAKAPRPVFTGPVLRASGSGWAPPRSWFADPGLGVPTPITIDDEGRVYGHAALWGTCHIGQAGVCVTPPHEDGHPYFMTGETLCADGGRVSVGQITVGTGHAPISYGARAAGDHYDNTGFCVADIAVGNDAHGIWVAGSVRPGADSLRVHELRAAGQVSGDWRRIGGSLRLVGLLAVNTPGFPVPKLRTRIYAGEQLALTASGIPQLGDRLTESELDQWAYARVMSALARRVHREE